MYKKMNPVIKEQWIKALENGEFEQGKEALCLVGIDGKRRYCCWGVLCKVMGEPETSRKPMSTCVSFAGSEGLPAASTLQRAGLDYETSIQPVSINERVAPLHAHNDDGVPFAKIAQAIREHF